MVVEDEAGLSGSSTRELLAIVRADGDVVSFLPEGNVPYNPFTEDPWLRDDPPPTVAKYGGQGASNFRQKAHLVLEGKSDGTAFPTPPRVKPESSQEKYAEVTKSGYCDNPRTDAQLLPVSQRTVEPVGPQTLDGYATYRGQLHVTSRVNVDLPDIYRVPVPQGAYGWTGQSPFTPYIFSTLRVELSANGQARAQWVDDRPSTDAAMSRMPWHYAYLDGQLQSQGSPPVDLNAWQLTAEQRVSTILPIRQIAWFIPFLDLPLDQLDRYANQQIFKAFRAECARQRVERDAAAGNAALQANFPKGDATPAWLAARDLAGPFLKEEILPYLTEAGFELGDPDTKAPVGCMVLGCREEAIKAFLFASPVEVQVYDAAGNHTGPRPDGTLEQAIPTVNYTRVGHYTWVMLPNDPSYRLELRGTGTGGLTINVADFERGTRVRYEQYSAVPVTPQASGTVQLGGRGAIIRYDEGQGPITLAPTSIVTSSGSDAADATPPTTTATLQGTLGQPGVYRSPVVVTLRPSDDLAGVDITEVSLDGGATWRLYEGPFTLQADGSYALAYRSRDYRGNQEAARSQTIVIDTVPPSTTASAPGVGASGWYAADVAVTLAATDGPGSGVQSLTYSSAGAQAAAAQTTSGASVQVVVAGEGETTISYAATDRAGNVEATKTLTVRLDKSRPVVACATPDAAWHVQDVRLACTASDALSGLASSSDASFTLSTAVPAGTETASARTGSRTVCDLAGNCTIAGPIGGIKVDKQPPSIAVMAPTAGPYLLRQVVPVAYTCSDGGAGVATCSGPVPSGASLDTAAVGPKTFTVSAADQVGNAAPPIAVAYSVTYNVCVLYDQTRAVNSGATVPLKLQLCDAAGANQSAASLTVTATGVERVSDQAPGALQDAGNANPDDNFRYDASLGGTGGYLYNLKTTGYLTGTYALRFSVAGDPGAAHGALPGPVSAQEATPGQPAAVRIPARPSRGPRSRGLLPGHVVLLVLLLLLGPLLAAYVWLELGPAGAPALPAPVGALPWRRQASGTQSPLFGVAYGQGQFVAVGDGGRILTSADGGLSWTASPTGLDPLVRLSGVGYGAGRFVAVGQDGLITTSEDGDTWTPRASGITTRSALTAVAYGEVPAGAGRTGRFVAAGSRGFAVSPDGLRWTPTPGVENAAGLTYANGQFVVVGGGTWVHTSSDGLRWTRRPVDLGVPDWQLYGRFGTLGQQVLDGVAFGAGRYVVVGGTGQDGVVLGSADGQRWRWEWRSQQDLRSVAYGGGQFVLVAGQLLLTSPDGLGWTAYRVPPPPGQPDRADRVPSPQTLRDVAYGDGRWVAVGWDGAIFTSP